MTPLTLDSVIRSLLLDSRTFAIHLTGYSSASQGGAEVAVRSIAASVRTMYRQMGGGDYVATTEEREGRLLVVFRPRDNPEEE